MGRAGRSLSLALLALVARPGAAAEPSTPASIAAAMKGSKITYSLVEPGAIKNPVKELDCPPRGPNLRVVVKPDTTSLVPWQPSKEAAPHFEAAEKSFSARDLAAAEAEYERGLAIDPSYGPGWLYAGDIPFARGDYAKALDDYRRALALDPTLAQAHRFAGDALFKLGRLAEAEDEYVAALAFDPSYDGPLQALELLGPRVGFTVVRRELMPPQRAIGELAGGTVQIEKTDPVWLPYLRCKAVWRNDPAYRRAHLGATADAAYGWSLNEERDCLGVLLAAGLDAAGAKPPLVSHLQEVAGAGLINGFIDFAIVGRRCPVAAALLPEGVREETARYVRTFVVVRPPQSPGKSPQKPPGNAP
jgi:tetratricopeptide (TPR) repeat protein